MNNDLMNIFILTRLFLVLSGTNNIDHYLPFCLLAHVTLHYYALDWVHNKSKNDHLM